MYGFIFLIQEKTVCPGMEDRMVWRKSKDKSFSINFFCGVLDGSYVKLFPRKIIWNSRVLTKVSFFAWEVWWGKVMTLDQLKK